MHADPINAASGSAAGGGRIVVRAADVPSVLALLATAGIAGSWEFRFACQELGIVMHRPLDD